jgi:hypothetical protein
MNRNKALLLLLLLASFSLAACSGLPKNNTCPGGNCGGNATVSFTLVADTLPPNPSILSFKVSIVAISLAPTSGTAQVLNPSPSIFDLMRLQSDTAFLGTLANVPSGSYTVQVTLSSPEIVFFNDTGSTITANGVACLNAAVCTATLAGIGTPTIGTFTFNATAGGQQGIEIDFNLNNAIVLSGGVLSVNFNPATPNPGVFTAFTLPRTNANLGTNQLELIEDFTGVVGITGSTVKITSLTRGVLTTTSTSASFFDPSPDGSVCPTSSTISCVVAGQVASVDAFLKLDGTLELKEFEPLNATQQDFVEGIIYSINNTNTTQFAIAVTDKVQAATGSLIAGLNTGDLLTVNIPAPQPFLVDTKGLPVGAIAPGTLGSFVGATNTTALRVGQNVALHVTSFTAAGVSTIASSIADTLTLRWSRLTATPATPFTQNTLNITGLPAYLNASGTAGVQTFSGTPGADGVTNFDGITDPTGLNVSLPVALRTLFVQNSTNTANPAFFAAKVRQH